MTLDNAAWSLLDRGGRLETLDRDECRLLLGSTNIGRLGYCTDVGPRIVPMNYTLVSEICDLPYRHRYRGISPALRSPHRVRS